MYYKILCSWFFTFIAIGLFAQKINDTLLSKNGTYRGTYIYKNNKYSDTAYIRIRFLDDTTFAYTTYQNGYKNETAIEANFYYNYSPGIARLKTFQDRKIWVGIQDMRLTYMDMDDIFSSPSDQITFSKALNKASQISKQPPSQDYQMINFIFKKDSVCFDFLNDCCKASREATRFRKIDNKKLLLTIDNSIAKYDSSFSVSTSTNKVVKRSVIRHDYNNFSEKEYTIKTNCTLTELPIPEKGNSNQITGYLKAGEKVRIRSNLYMNYIYVGQLDPKDKFIVTKSGWIPIEYLQK